VVTYISNPLPNFSDPSVLYNIIVRRRQQRIFSRRNIKIAAFVTNYCMPQYKSQTAFINLVLPLSFGMPVFISW
jgi:hypothetical protein